MSIQYTAPGIKPTTFQTWVVTHNHYTRAFALSLRFFIQRNVAERERDSWKKVCKCFQDGARRRRQTLSCELETFAEEIKLVHPWCHLNTQKVFFSLQSASSSCCKVQLPVLLLLVLIVLLLFLCLTKLLLIYSFVWDALIDQIP